MKRKTLTFSSIPSIDEIKKMIQDEDLPGDRSKLDQPQSNPRADSADPEVVTLLDRTKALAAGLAEVLRTHGASEGLVSQLKEQLGEFLNCSSDEGGWSKRAKHALNSPLNRYLRNPPAPQDFPDFEPSGRLRRWLRCRLHEFNRKNTHLWYSWFQAKRSALPASQDLIEATYRKHQQTLTTPDVGLIPENVEHRDRILDNPDFNRLLDTVSKSVQDFLYEKGPAGQYGSKRRRVNKKFTDYQPSLHACFEQRRQDGGSQRELTDLSGLSVGPNSDPHAVYSSIEARTTYRYYQCFDILPKDLVSMKFYPVVFDQGSKRTYYNVVMEVRGSFGEEQWSSSLQRKLRAWDCGSPLNCTIQGVVEPLKVRVISKGPALQYYSQKPLQKALHDSIRRIPCFRLTGQTFCPTMLLDLKRFSEPGDKWMSVDYSAATDGLSWEYSGRILEKVLSRLPLEDRLAAFRVLGPHQLHYGTTTRLPLPPGVKPWKKDAKRWGTVPAGMKVIPPSDGTEPLTGFQTTGQLMGSPLSFPILCLANAGVYFDVTESLAKERSWSYQDRLNAFLCNGDDMLYAAPSLYWDRHVDVGKSVGLVMSPGKAYVHSIYSNVNSVSCHFDLDRQDSTPYQINFLNTGLLFGQHKVLSSKKTQVGKTKDFLGQPGKDGKKKDSFLVKCSQLKEKVLSILNESENRSRIEQFVGLGKGWRQRIESDETMVEFDGFDISIFGEPLPDYLNLIPAKGRFREIIRAAARLTVRTYRALSRERAEIRRMKRKSDEKFEEDFLARIQKARSPEDLEILRLEKLEAQALEIARLLDESARAEALQRQEEILEGNRSIDCNKLAGGRVSRKLSEEIVRELTDQSLPTENLSSVVNLLLEGCLGPRSQCLTLARFLKLHKETLRQECRLVVRVGRSNRFHMITRNLFLPISRGGMGIIAPVGWKFKVSNSQRMLANLGISLNKIPTCTRYGPAPGYPLTSFQSTEVMPFDHVVRPVSRFDPTKRPFDYNSSYLKKISHGRIPIRHEIVQFSPIPDAPVLDHSPDGFLSKRTRWKGILPSVSPSGPTIFQVASRPAISWFDDFEIWQPDQPCDRLGWLPDLTDCGDVEPNPGPPPNPEVTAVHPPSRWHPEGTEEVRIPLGLSSLTFHAAIEYSSSEGWSPVGVSFRGYQPDLDGIWEELIPTIPLVSNPGLISREYLTALAWSYCIERNQAEGFVQAFAFGSVQEDEELSSHSSDDEYING